MQNLEDVITVRILTFFVVTFLAIFSAFSVHASSQIGNLDGNNVSPDEQKPELPVKVSWVLEQYDLDWIEEHIDEYYANYYKSYERYLGMKQREIAGKFGLSNILVRPNFRQYEKTKMVLSRKIWGDRIVLRYIAPVGDLTDYSFSLVVKPYHHLTCATSANRKGEVSLVVLYQRAIGGNGGNIDDPSQEKLSRLLRSIGRITRTR